MNNHLAVYKSYLFLSCALIHMQSDKGMRKHVRVVLHLSAQLLSSNEDSREPVVNENLTN